MDDVFASSPELIWHHVFHERRNSFLMAELGQQSELNGWPRVWSITELADQSGRVRDVIYRLEAGKETSLSSLFAVLAVLN